MEITDKRYLWKCIQSSNITQSWVHELLSKTEKRQREKKPSYLHEHCESKHILEYEDHFRHPWGDDVCCSGFFPITNSFCNSSQHAAPVSVPNWPLFLVVFDRPTVLHWKKKSSKSTVLSLDFTTNPLEQEHVRDRSVKCTPAVRKQLHRTTVAQNLPVLWHPIREPWINVPACMKDLWGRGVCRINIAVGLRACVQNNYMLHCCDKNGPKQLLFATNLAWEVPNSGGQKSHWILYASKYAFPGGCWLLVA